MFPGFHAYDLIIVLVVALVIFGPKKLPELGSSIGKSIKEYRKSMKDVSPPREEEVHVLTTSTSEAPAQDAVAASRSQTSVTSQERKG